MPRVELRKIDLSFGTRALLRGLDLCIESGQYVVLLGPSGCGKTTLLKTIAGLQQPDRGEVLVAGHCVNQVAPRHRDVALVFQDDSLYPHLTVAESLRMGLRGRVDPRELQTRIARAAEMARVEPILDRYPDRLSGGELRRAAVAKAIARGAAIRLLDEPLSALDAPLRDDLQEDLLRWHASTAGTTLHVTHDGQEAMRMADKIAVMEKGQILQFDTPAEVYANPASLAVARAIGSPPINLFSARLAAGKIAFDQPQLAIHSEVKCSGGKTSDEIIVAVRPPDLRLCGDDSQLSPQPSTDLQINGQSWRASLAQDRLHLVVEIGTDRLTAVVPPESYMPAATLRLTAAVDTLLFFDAATHRRIIVEPAG